MKIFPAIDIKDKKCVRLVKGDFDNKTEYKNSPIDQANSYKDYGFKNLHIVDLDGALTGETVNVDIIQEIVKNSNLKIEIGGGIRNFDSIQKYIDVGVDKVISKNLNFQNVCIYLDAHLCQDHLKNTKTFGNENTATPILNELEIITKYLANFEKIVVLIDDIRLFQGKFQNYPNKNTLVSWCKKNNFLWEIEQDIFICKKI